MSASLFNYALMQLLCQELQARLSHYRVIDCFPNDLCRFSFVLEKQQHREILFFCFTPPFIRFNLIQFSSVPRGQSSHPLLFFLAGALLEEVNLLQKDRILQLKFQTLHGERLFIAEFFSKNPNYYLTDSKGTILFTLYSVQHSHYQLPSPPLFISQPTSLWSNHLGVEQAYAKLEKQAKFAQEKQALQAQLTTKTKKIRRKEQELVENLKQCNQWPLVQHEAELIKSNFNTIKKGLSSLIVQDWITEQPYELKLDATQTPQEAMAARFRQAKKLRSGIIPLTHYLERVHKELFSIEKRKQELDKLQTLEELLSFKLDVPFLTSRQKQKVYFSNLSLPIYREYQSAAGLKIWVGKNARANDHLTFQLANGRDWWLHVKGYSGSHVIIRLARDQEPDAETLKDAMQLALYYSKARAQGEGEICFTPRKYVSRLGRGKAELVQISKQRTAWVRFDSIRYQSLQERLNLKTF